MSSRRPGKYKRQFKYADERNIPFVCLLGPDEVANGTVAIKNMKTGDQVSVSRSDAAAKTDWRCVASPARVRRRRTLPRSPDSQFPTRG